MLDQGEQRVDLLVVEVAGYSYALLLSTVIEIHRAAAIVRLPRAPAIIEGVIDVHGRILPVLDIRARFGHPARAVLPEDHLVVARAAERIVVLRVDEAREIASVEAAAIQSAAALSGAIEYVAGVARLAEGTVVIHDLASFLSAAESAHLDAALVQADEVMAAP